jgi:hypothetical protein
LAILFGTIEYSNGGGLVGFSVFGCAMAAGGWISIDSKDENHTFRLDIGFMCSFKGILKC